MITTDERVGNAVRQRRYRSRHRRIDYRPFPEISAIIDKWCASRPNATVGAIIDALVRLGDDTASQD
jgi:hypothetical protein